LGKGSNVNTLSTVFVTPFLISYYDFWEVRKGLDNLLKTFTRHEGRLVDPASAAKGSSAEDVTLGKDL